MTKMQECRQDLSKALAPYGLFLQRRTLSDEKTQGFPIEPGIWAVAGIAIGTFLHAFFKAFGQECGKSAGKALSKWLSAADTPEALTEQIDKSSEAENKEAVTTIHEVAMSLERTRYEQFAVEARQSVAEAMRDCGLPRSRAETASTEIITIIERHLTETRE